MRIHLEPGPSGYWSLCFHTMSRLMTIQRKREQKKKKKGKQQPRNQSILICSRQFSLHTHAHIQNKVWCLQTKAQTFRSLNLVIVKRPLGGTSWALVEREQSALQLHSFWKCVALDKPTQICINETLHCSGGVFQHGVKKKNPSLERCCLLVYTMTLGRRTCRHKGAAYKMNG